MIAHVQYRRGLPATEGCYSAWRALEDRGCEIRTFERIADVDVDAGQPVIGGVDQVVEALARLDVSPPDIDYPTGLREFLLDPNLTGQTMSWVRHATQAWPVFIKPTTGRREFTGRVVRRPDDLLGLAHIDDELPVFVSHPVDLGGRVEWRAFIIDGEVRDIRPYTSCPSESAPSKVFVKMFVNQWNTHPAGCSIDVVDLGERGRPDWRVVERNDGYSVGSYGMHPHSYAELLVKRWAELTRHVPQWP